MFKIENWLSTRTANLDLSQVPIGQNEDDLQTHKAQPVDPQLS